MYNQFNPYNQYYNQPRYQQPIQQVQPIQPIQPLSDTKSIGLQGKLIDSIEVAKAIDINLDGSISYFPLTDGSAIITKQLQTDGTSKTIIYKPSDDKVKEIYRSKLSNRALSKIYHVSDTNIGYIKNKKQWEWLTDTLD